MRSCPSGRRRRPSGTRSRRARRRPAMHPLPARAAPTLHALEDRKYRVRPAVYDEAALRGWAPRSLASVRRDAPGPDGIPTQFVLEAELGPPELPSPARPSTIVISQMSSPRRYPTAHQRTREPRQGGRLGDDRPPARRGRPGKLSVPKHASPGGGVFVASRATGLRSARGDPVQPGSRRRTPAGHAVSRTRSAGAPGSPTSPTARACRAMRASTRTRTRSCRRRDLPGRAARLRDGED